MKLRSPWLIRLAAFVAAFLVRLLIGSLRYLYRPRGQGRNVQMGVIYMAALTGLPIVPIGFAWKNAGRMQTWDRFPVLLPFSRAVCVTTEPINVPETTDRDQLEVYRLRVQEAMDR